MTIEDEDQNVFAPEESEEETAEEAEETTETEAEEEKGGEEEEATPAPKDDKETKSEKMIPESQFKAALKDQATRYETELSKHRQSPEAPDRDNDPEGYERHIRLEASREIMRESKEDYDEVIQHFGKMAEVNPDLNNIVANHKMPAKFAYDLAKKDIKLKETEQLADSPEFKEFLALKKSGGKQDSTATKLSSRPKVPNLNRSATAVDLKGKQSNQSEDDGLFDGHYSVR